jgi:hypothetical protein
MTQVTVSLLQAPTNSLHLFNRLFQWHLSNMLPNLSNWKKDLNTIKDLNQYEVPSVKLSFQNLQVKSWRN